MRFFKKLLSLIMPHKCAFCREAIEYDNQTYICKDCMNTLPFITSDICVRCGTPREELSMPVCYTCRRFSHSFSKSFTPLIYKDNVRRSILSMKFYQKESFCHAFAFLIVNRILESGFPDIDFITYIPLSKESYSERGFNQAELIAKECGKLLSLPVVGTLTRVNGTPRQSSLPMRLRRQNVKKAFKAKDISLKGTALLIDDIYTTGSTMAFNSSLLLKMGCDKVYIACVALAFKD